MFFSPAVITGPVDATLAEAELLRSMLSGDGTRYSDGNVRLDRALARRLQLMGHNGMVTFVDAATGGWDKEMWGAAVTCVGANAAYRHFGSPGWDLHLGGCAGSWRPDGSCSACPALRVLDAAAWATYADVTADELPRARLYCVEHGFLRERHVTTSKTCPLRGTTMHDAGLMRM